MEKYSPDFDESIFEVSKQYGLNNLLNVDSKLDGRGYWPRIAGLSFFEKLFQQHRYHFLYEIQGLSNQIHFGIASSLLFREKMSKEHGKPNGYNHRYAFMVESTIHTIYSYWNRVALVLNTYLKAPLFKERVYFSKVVRQLEIDYPELMENPYFIWLKTVKDDVEALDRNEFAHNNSLLMQEFIPVNIEAEARKKLVDFPELLISHNKAIVEQIYDLVELLEFLEGLNNQRND